MYFNLSVNNQYSLYVYNIEIPQEVTNKNTITLVHYLAQ